jgi:hypothetical protein
MLNPFNLRTFFDDESNKIASIINNNMVMNKERELVQFCSFERYLDNVEKIIKKEKSYQKKK